MRATKTRSNPAYQIHAHSTLSASTPYFKCMVMKEKKFSGIPAITGEIDGSKAIKIFPELFLPYRSTILAYGTSLMSTTIGFPFDTIKTRRQTYKNFTSNIDCVVKTFKAEGYRGFFRGITAPLISTSFVRSLSVSIFTSVKPRIYQLFYGKTHTDGGSELRNLLKNFPVCFVGGAAAGAGVSLIACPFEFCKVYSQIAMLAQRQAQTHTKQTSLYKLSVRETATKVMRQEGVFGLYSGYRYHLTRDIVGSGVYFSVYESFKWATNKLINSDLSLSSPFSILLAGGMSGLTCWAVVYPIDTTKSLIQKDIVTNIIRKEEGLKPLPSIERKLSVSREIYRGLGLSMTRSFLVNMVFFSVYEFSMKHFI